eukprot:TRINITY_DN183_c4_g1_i1.p1 TRINITY_DN183_c4_g1~~TRINITY_DN183_c4_g1_i1.p1  ORF type:complete len:456 (+),score=56.43 TRINITY_DN183_c4_g1_i1:115-1482(+)
MSLPTAPTAYGVYSPRWKKQVEHVWNNYNARKQQETNQPISTTVCSVSPKKRTPKDVSLPQLQQAESENLDVGSRIFGEYIVTRILGKGSFGSVFEAVYGPTGTCVAIKAASNPQPVQQLKREAAAYAHCHAAVQKKNLRMNIPKMHWAGPCKNYHIIILELLGKDVESLSQMNHRGVIPEQDLSKMACQMFAVIRTLHCQAHCVHGDIKPANFAFKGSDIYLLDFGFARLWRDNSGKHIDFDQSDDRFIGTPRFASCSVHDGVQLSRRDDLVSFLYTLIFLLRGTLPWAALKSSKEIRDCKASLTSMQLTEGHPYLAPFFDQVGSLEFADEPNYNYLQKLLDDWSGSLQRTVPVVKEILPPILSDSHQQLQGQHAMRRVLASKPSPPSEPRSSGSFNPHSHRFNPHRNVVDTNQMLHINAAHCDPSIPPTHPSPPGSVRSLPSAYITTCASQNV